MATGFDVSYTYDAVGNRLTETSSAGTITYTYDAANQLTLEEHPTHLVTYTYDPDGNVIEKLDDGLSTVYEWDENNQLISVETPSASDPTTFTYNGDGQRVAKQTGAEITKYLYDFDRLLLETDGSDNVELEYTSTVEEYGDTLSETSPTDTLYHQHNAPGSTSALIHDSDAAVERYAYRAFGLATDQPSGQPTNLTFIGQQQYYWDIEAELYLLGMGNSQGGGRFYDPTAGRFISQDPAGPDTDPLKNLYRYVGNNPVNTTDPSGMGEPFLSDLDGLVGWKSVVGWVDQEDYVLFLGDIEYAEGPHKLVRLVRPAGGYTLVPYEYIEKAAKNYTGDELWQDNYDRTYIYREVYELITNFTESENEDVELFIESAENIFGDDFKQVESVFREQGGLIFISSHSGFQFDHSIPIIYIEESNLNERYIYNALRLFEQWPTLTESQKALQISHLTDPEYWEEDAPSEEYTGEEAVLRNLQARWEIGGFDLSAELLRIFLDEQEEVSKRTVYDFSRVAAPLISREPAYQHALNEYLIGLARNAPANGQTVRFDYDSSGFGIGGKLFEAEFLPVSELAVAYVNDEATHDSGIGDIGYAIGTGHYYFRGDISVSRVDTRSLSPSIDPQPVFNTTYDFDIDVTVIMRDKFHFSYSPERMILPEYRAGNYFQDSLGYRPVQWLASWPMQRRIRITVGPGLSDGYNVTYLSDNE